MYLIFTTDHHHSHSSKQLIGVAISKWYSFRIIDQYCEKNDEPLLTSKDLRQLATSNQTQSQQDRNVEFVVEEYELENGSYKLVKSAFQRELIGVEEAQTTKYLLKEDGIHIFGNGFVRLNENIRNEEAHEYYIVDRKEFIENLIQWISECKTSKEKELMMEDLHLLMNWKDDYILSSNSTNEYINSDSHNFNEVCEELIELNEQY